MNCTVCEMSGCEMLAWENECCLCAESDLCSTCEEWSEMEAIDWHDERDEYDLEQVFY